MMAREDNKMAMEILCKWSSKFRSDLLEWKKFNPRVPFTSQPVEAKLLSKMESTPGSLGSHRIVSN